MSHFLFWLNMISFIMGFTAVIVAFFLYLKWKQKLLLYYLFFLLSMTFSVIGNAIYIYYYFNISYKIDFIVTPTTGILINCLLIYTAPLFFSHLLGTGFSRTKKMFFGSLSILLFLFAVLIFLFTESLSASQWSLILNKSRLGGIISLLILSYFAFYTIFNIKKIDNPSLRKTAAFFMILYFIFLPGLITDVLSSRLYYFITDFLSLPEGFNFNILFYFFWNIFSLIFAGKYLFQQPIAPGDAKLAGTIFKMFGISEREGEVALLLLKGSSYKEIAEKLFISIKTVKTHLHNIYQETNMRNKIELSNLIRQTEKNFSS